MTDEVTPRDRQHWMSILATAPSDELEARWRTTTLAPEYRTIRGPEVGLIMVRARAGGAGVRFNLGEMTITRCTVQLASGTLGHAWVGGRRLRHAEIAAVLDALLQDPVRRTALRQEVVAPLEALAEASRQARAAKAAATRVEFFTMVRGED